MIETTGQPILIIGGTGVQGGNVAREMLKHNYRVRVLSRNPQSAAAQEIAAKEQRLCRATWRMPVHLSPL